MTGIWRQGGRSGVPERESTKSALRIDLVASGGCGGVCGLRSVVLPFGLYARGLNLGLRIGTTGLLPSLGNLGALLTSRTGCLLLNTSSPTYYVN